MEGVNYHKTYSPVVSSSTIRFMLYIVIIMEFDMEFMDFVLALPQAPIKTNIYMQPQRLPHWFNILDPLKLPSRFTHVYKLAKKLYELNNAGRAWNESLH